MAVFVCFVMVPGLDLAFFMVPAALDFRATGADLRSIGAFDGWLMCFGLFCDGAWLDFAFSWFRRPQVFVRRVQICKRLVRCCVLSRLLIRFVSAYDSLLVGFFSATRLRGNRGEFSGRTSSDFSSARWQER